MASTSSAPALSRSATSKLPLEEPRRASARLPLDAGGLSNLPARPKRSGSLPHFHPANLNSNTSPANRSQRFAERHEQRHLAAFAEAYDLGMSLPKGFLSALHQKANSAEARRRSLISLQQGFIVDTGWSPEGGEEHTKKTLATLRMTDETFDRAVVDQEARARHLKYTLSGETAASRNQSEGSDKQFWSQRASALADQLDTMEEEVVQKRQKLQELHLELHECEKLSERADASKHLDALRGMDQRLQDALARLQNDEAMMAHMRHRLDRDNFDFSRKSNALQQELKKCSIGAEKLVLYCEQLEAARQHSETTIGRFQHFLDVERSTRTDALERRRLLAIKRQEEERRNVARLAKQVRAKEQEVKADIVTEMQGTEDSRQLQAKREQQHSYEAGAKRVVEASGTTNIAQVIERHEHISRTSSQLHESKRVAEARSASLKAELRAKEKMRGEMELLGVNRDGALDEPIKKLEGKVAVQDARTDEARRRLQAVLPLLQRISTGCRNMQRMLGLRSEPESSEHPPTAEMPARPDTAPAAYHSGQPMHPLGVSGRPSASAADLQAAQGARDELESSAELQLQASMDQAQLNDYAEAVEILARIESTLLHGPMRSHARPRQAGAPMSKAEAAALRDARSIWSSNPDNLRITLDGDGGVSFGMHTGGMDDDDLEQLALAEEPDEKAEKELTFSRFAHWKVNPVVHDKRGILGYARTPVRNPGARTGIPEEARSEPALRGGSIGSPASLPSLATADKVSTSMPRSTPTRGGPRRASKADYAKQNKPPPESSTPPLAVPGRVM